MEQGQVVFATALAMVLVAGALMVAVVATLSKGWVMVASSLAFLSYADGQSILLTAGACAAAFLAIVGTVKVCTKPFTKYLRQVLNDHTIEVVEPLIAPIREDVAELRSRLDGR